MRFLSLAAGLLVQILSTAAVAAVCGQASTQLELNECAALAFQQSDADLNAAFREIAARLAADPEGKQRLTAAQRAWLAFRDADCAFVSAPIAGGSIQPMVRATCLDGLTRARLAQLRAWLACPEGDLACPVPAGAP